ncbi:MAG: PAS domain-containing protein [Candidatus Eremiobacterota bacterium]
MSWKSSIAALVREARLSAGLSQEKLAEQASVSPLSISKFENGRVSPRVATIEKIARATGYPLQWFFGGRSAGPFGAIQWLGWSVDPQLKILTLCGPVSRGLERREFLGRPVKNLIDAPDIEDVHRLAFRGVPGRVAFELQERRYQGRVALQDGQVEGLSLDMGVPGLSARDDLKSELARLSGGADHSPLLVAYLDRALRYVWVNPAFERAFGIRRQDLVGAYAGVLGATEGWVHPTLQRALEGEEVRCHGPWPFQDGTIRIAESGLFPDRDQDGKVQGIYAIFRPWNPEVELDERVCGLSFRSLLELAGDGVVVLDPQSRLAWVSQGVCHRLGYSADQLPGRPASTLLSEGSLLLLQRRVLERRQGFEGALCLELRSRDGHLATMLGLPHSLHDLDGKHLGTCACLIDADRTQADAILRLVEKTERELLGASEDLALLRALLTAPQPPPG